MALYEAPYCDAKPTNLSALQNGVIDIRTSIDVTFVGVGGNSASVLPHKIRIEGRERKQTRVDSCYQSTW